jgi:hypothetical protein
MVIVGVVERKTHWSIVVVGFVLYVVLVLVSTRLKKGGKQ